jgi:hypothetical protein
MMTLISFGVFFYVLYLLASGQLRGEDPPKGGPKVTSKKRKRRGSSRRVGELRNINEWPMGR